ncbi:MAG: uroporphyrinogen-III decarboxylase-like protein, partial [Nitrososphaeria archaeon]|nr:uroporphyrinogen-III decarboxylase-like protein [Nitrososphaeria archaeon]
IIPYFINIGVDVIDPLQPECNNLRRVKELYGKKLAFHGCISVQRTLAFGTVKDVENEVISVINIMDKNGGYILSPAHKIDLHMPIENILSLYDFAKKYGVYK